MTTTKLNLGLSISRNYNKVTIELLEEIIIHETEEELKTKIREKLNLIRGEVDYEFNKHGVVKDGKWNETNLPL